MKIKPNFLPFFMFLVCFLGLTSVTLEDKKPHLLEGCWQTTTENTVKLPIGKNLKAYQFFFGSNEFLMQMTLETKRGKTKKFMVAYSLIEKEEVQYLYCRITNDEDFRLIFSIKDLSKKWMVLKFEEELSSEHIEMDNATIKFERVAGPPENMD